MRVKAISLLGAGLVALLASACAAPGASPSLAATPQEVESTPASAPPQTAAPSETAAPSHVVASDSGDEVVCKTHKVTGSRLIKGKVCKTKREWQDSSILIQDQLRDYERRRSAQPGGETMSP